MLACVGEVLSHRVMCDGMGASNMQVALTAMLWGAGTAVGEVPPYFLSYKAAVAGQRNDLMEEAMSAGG
jgi:hypothetical protein